MFALAESSKHLFQLRVLSVVDVVVVVVVVLVYYRVTNICSVV
jgi:uncharacterized membrane protein